MEMLRCETDKQRMARQTKKNREKLHFKERYNGPSLTNLQTHQHTNVGCCHLVEQSRIKSIAQEKNSICSRIDSFLHLVENPWILSL